MKFPRKRMAWLLLRIALSPLMSTHKSKGISGSLLKRQTNFVADDILGFVFVFFVVVFFCFKEKSLDISCELSAKQMIHMKHQDLFSMKNKNR